jgi:hypothetical protein
MVCTLIVTLTGVVVFGAEFFGEPALRTPEPFRYLAYNIPNVLVPLAVLIRMRRPEPFARKF